jgi:hypothetical protein
VKKHCTDCHIVVAVEKSGFGTRTPAITDTHYYVVVEDSRLYEIPR